jgi:hypothetical protein
MKLNSDQLRGATLIAVTSLVIALGVISWGPAIAEVSTSGAMFLDYKLDLSSEDKAGDKLLTNDFSIGRVYVNLKSDLSEKVSMRFTTDVYKGKDQSVVVDGKSFVAIDDKSFDVVDDKSFKVSPSKYYDAYTIRVKYAYVDFKKVIPHTKITFGLQGTPWTGMIDKSWGYRLVSKSLFDQYKVMATADYSVGFTVSIPSGYGEGVIQVVNGNGYSKLETNKHKDIIARILLIPLPKDEILKSLGVAGFYYLGKDDDGNAQNRAGGHLRFKYDFINLSGEFGISTDGKDEISGMGFASAVEIKLDKIEPLKPIAIIGRLESWDKNTDNDDDEIMRVIGGISCKAVKNVTGVVTFQNKFHFKGKEKVNDQLVVVQAEVKF